MTREQGAEESNLGSMEHRVCHKIMVFYTIEIFRLASLGILTQIYTSGLISIQGANSQMLREQGDTKIDLGSTKNYFGSIKKIIQGAGRKGSIFKGSREPGTPPYRVSLIPVRLPFQEKNILIKTICKHNPLTLNLCQIHVLCSHVVASVPN